jgi:hypothetical protein
VPGSSGLELGGQPYERCLVELAGDELDADRKPVVAPVERYRDRWLTGDIDERRERREEGLASERAVRVAVGVLP